MGELKCLKTLSIFIVDSKAGFGLEELCDLQLRGKIHIKSLENVLNERDAIMANLKRKKHLNSLYLSWGYNAEAKCTDAKSERILEALEPHSSLKRFWIKGYKGTKLPSWMKNTWILSSLVCVALYDCKNCEELPPLGKLPHLEILYVSGNEHVKHIDEDSYDGVEEKAFKSLKELTLSMLPKLERMLKDERVEMLPLLSHLTISCVPKFKLPNLPSIKYLHIRGFDRDRDFGGNVDMESFVQDNLKNMHHVKILWIEKFPKMRELPHELGSFTSLQVLEIRECEELESLSENVLQGLSSLRTLRTYHCSKLKSLSEGVGHLSSLENLEISCCPELVSLPDNMNKLTALRGVRIAGQKIPKGLQNIPSLQRLNLWKVESLPEWLGDITSLQQIEIQFCEELNSLPTSFRHLKNLQKLNIRYCPKLEKRCKRVTGEDWPYIAHIPDFEFYPDPVEGVTFCDKLRSMWNTMRNRPISNSNDYDTFDKMVDRTL